MSLHVTCVLREWYCDKCFVTSWTYILDLRHIIACSLRSLSMDKADAPKESRADLESKEAIVVVTEVQRPSEDFPEGGLRAWLTIFGG